MLKIQKHKNTEKQTRLLQILGTSLACQASNPMTPYDMPGRVAKLVTMLVVRARSTMPWYVLQQAATLMLYRPFNPFASEAVYTRNLFFGRMSDSV